VGKAMRHFKLDMVLSAKPFSGSVSRPISTSPIDIFMPFRKLAAVNPLPEKMVF
jgi:hypothetical protein